MEKSRIEKKEKSLDEKLEKLFELSAPESPSTAKMEAMEQSIFDALPKADRSFSLKNIFSFKLFVPAFAMAAVLFLAIYLPQSGTETDNNQNSNSVATENGGAKDPLLEALAALPEDKLSQLNGDLAEIIEADELESWKQQVISDWDWDDDSALDNSYNSLYEIAWL